MLSALALGTLDSIMSDDSAPAPARVTAARAVIEFAVKAIEIEDVLARIEALESATNEKER